MQEYLRQIQNKILGSRWACAHILLCLFFMCLGNAFCKFDGTEFGGATLGSFPLSPYRVLLFTLPISLAFAILVGGRKSAAGAAETVGSGSAAAVGSGSAAAGATTLASGNSTSAASTSSLGSAKKNSFLAFLLILSAYAILSLFWAKDRTAGVSSCVYILSASFFSYCIHLFANCKKNIVIALRIILFASLLVAFGAIYEIFSADFLFDPKDAPNYLSTDKRIGAALPAFAMINVNDLAVYQYLALFFAVCLLILDQNKIFKILSVVAIGIFLFVMYASMCRSTDLALVFAIASLAAYLFLRFRKTHKKASYIGLAAFILAFISLVYVFVNSYSVDFITLQKNNISNIARISSTEHSLYLFFRTALWPIGFGAGNIEYYNSYYTIYQSYLHVPHIHFWFLELLLSFGILVFALYCYLYAKSFFGAVKSIRQRQNTQNLLLALCFAILLISFVPCSLACSSFITIQWFFPFWTLIYAIYHKLILN